MRGHEGGMRGAAIFMDYCVHVHKHDTASSVSPRILRSLNSINPRIVPVP